MNTGIGTTSVDPSRRIEELGRIIMAYSEITEKLEQSHMQLQQQIVNLTNELSEKNRELERRNRLAALGEMAAGLAHEIRNPLGGIQLYASMVIDDLKKGVMPELKVLEKITGGVRRLEGLVSQVLQFSREIRAEIEPCDLAFAVNDAVEVLTSLSQNRNVKVIAQTPGAMHGRVDPRLISHAVMNLVRNAIEAVEPGGAVEVKLQPFEAGQFSLIVTDDGPGIKPEILDRIFNPFFTTKDEGTGLGLSIVHRIVEAHGGTITATNRPEGGARFEIRI